MIKRATALLVHGMNSVTGGSSLADPTSSPTSSRPEETDYHEMLFDQQPGRDPNSAIGQWVPEINPTRWLIINGLWCITYAVPLLALFWRDKSAFYYTEVFYITVNVVSCITWVAQLALSAYWFWAHWGGYVDLN